MHHKNITLVALSALTALTMCSCANNTNTSQASVSSVTESSVIQTATDSQTITTTSTAASAAPTTANPELPPNLKIYDVTKILAYSKDADFDGFKEFSSKMCSKDFPNGFDSTTEYYMPDDNETIANFIDSNPIINVPLGSTISFDELQNYDTLSTALKNWLFYRLIDVCKCDIGIKGADYNEAIITNNNASFSYGLVFSRKKERNGNYYTSLSMYVKYE